MLVLAIIAMLLMLVCSGAEIAFLSFGTLNIELQRKEDSPRGRILAGFYDQPERFLSTLLLAHTTGMVVLTYCLVRMLEPIFSTALETEVLSLVIIGLMAVGLSISSSYLLPKIFFRLYSTRLLHYFAQPLSFLQKIYRPFVWTFNTLSYLFLKYVIRTDIPQNRPVLTAEKLSRLIQDSSDEQIENLEEDIFKNALQFRDLRVRDCMVPRTEIKHIDVASGLDEIIGLFRETKHSRLIITEEGDIDRVKGYIHHLQLLNRPEDIQKILMDVFIVPGVRKAQDLLLDFMQKGTNIALVVDEFGSISGLITLEDILEEIFGEIEDEHDREHLAEETIKAGAYRFSGRLEISYINEQYEDLQIPEGDYHTLSGYIVYATSKIPAQGEEFVLNNLKFIPEKVSETKVEQLKVELLEEE